MPTLDQLNGALAKADAAGDTEAAQTFAADIKAHPDYRGTATGWQKLGEGLKGGLLSLGSAAVGLSKATPVGALLDMGGKAVLGDKNPNDVVRSASEHHDKVISPQLGWQGTVGEAIPDVVASALPILRGAKVLESGVKWAGKAAPAVADVAANALWSGGKAAAQGKDLGTVATDAAVSGGGAGAARLLSKTFRAGGKAVSPDFTPNAKTAMDAGLPITPGQATDGGAWGAAETFFKSLPVTGKQVVKRQNELGEGYAKKLADDALAHIGAKSEGTGLNMLDHADKVIGDAYEKAVPRTFGDTNEVINELNHVRERIDTVPFLSDSQRSQLLRYIDNSLFPEVNKHGTSLTGRAMRDMDIKLGSQARAYQQSTNPEHWPMGSALRELQAAIRGTIKGMDDEALGDIQKANNAFREWLPVEDATFKSIKNPQGTANPERLLKAKEKFQQKRTPLDSAVNMVQPGLAKQGSIMDRLIGAGASIGGGSMSLPLAAGIHGFSTAAYSPAGIRAQMATLRKLQGLRAGVTGSKPYQFMDENSLATLLGGMGARTANE